MLELLSLGEVRREDKQQSLNLAWVFTPTVRMDGEPLSSVKQGAGTMIECLPTQGPFKGCPLSDGVPEGNSEQTEDCGLRGRMKSQTQGNPQPEK